MSSDTVADSGLAFNPTNSKPVTVFEPLLLLMISILSCLGAIIGIQIIVTLGVSANTSIIGAMLAILVSVFVNEVVVSSLSRFLNQRLITGFFPIRV